MKLKDVEALVDQDPARRAMQMLMLGSEMAETKKKKPGKLAVPAALRAESVMGDETRGMLMSLHGVSVEEPQAMTGLRSTGRTLQTAAGEVDDLVLTPQGRKKRARAAMRRTAGVSVEDLALRQLGVGMLESDPHTRVCAAYAYWQATGWSEPVMPILHNGMDSSDSDECLLSATCMAHIDAKQTRKLQGTIKDDRPQTPIQPVKPSMTVLIHGTFAMKSRWYKPGGDFHTYIKSKVYKDVYSGPDDFYSWSGRYHLLDSELEKIWKAAARKLVAWCNAHPTNKLRLIAHSHGCNVVNIATQLGLKACSLIQLSPPVRDWNLPKMQNVSSNRIFNIHSRFDPVVFVDGGAQDYSDTAVSAFERTRTISFSGHSHSHDKDRWKKKKIPAFVKTVCQ